MKQARIGDTEPVESKGVSGVWDRVGTDDILMRILELLAPDMKSNCHSRLVCKHWNSSWQCHNWAPLWSKQGPWLRVYCSHGSRIEELSDVHELWSLQNAPLFSTHHLHYPFTTSSQGLVAGVSTLYDIIIYNPLSVKRGVQPLTLPYEIPTNERFRVLLHVQDAARGIYKIGVVNTHSTDVYDSVTGEWEKFKTPQEFLSQRDIFRACLLASRAAAADASIGHRNPNPFTFPGIYMMQYFVDHKEYSDAEEQEQQQQEPAWVANSEEDFPRGFPDDVPLPFGMFLVNAAPGRVAALVFKAHSTDDERFMEVFVYELVETEGGDSVCWRRLGATRVLEGASSGVLNETRKMDCYCAENIIVLQLPIFWVDHSIRRECEKIQPLVFNLDDRSWTSLNLDSVKYSHRLVKYIFKPNPLASTTFVGES